MKNTIKLFAIIAALSLTCAVMAQDATTKPAAALRGKVTKVDGMVITVTSKAGETAVTTDANTSFTLDGEPATLADVKVGEKLTVTPSTGVASEVKLVSAKKKKKAPATAPAAN